MKRKNAKKAALFIAFGALMYLRGRIVPKYADDYPYSFNWDPHFGNLTRGVKKYERVKSLKDLVRSQAAHYKTWDGRVLADFLVQLNLLKDDKKYFDVINTAMILAHREIRNSKSSCTKGGAMWFRPFKFVFFIGKRK